jgi:hypothetical protein
MDLSKYISFSGVQKLLGAVPNASGGCKSFLGGANHFWGRCALPPGNLCLIEIENSKNMVALAFV